LALGLAGAQKLGVADRYRDHPDQVLLLLANDLISRAIRDASGKSLPSGGRNETSDQLANCDIQRPAAAFLSGSNSACTENGFRQKRDAPSVKRSLSNGRVLVPGHVDGDAPTRCLTVRGEARRASSHSAMRRVTSPDNVGHGQRQTA
jgi:hypothetical protein